MRMAIQRRSAGSTKLWSTATPSSPSWLLSRRWETCRLTLETPPERWVPSCFHCAWQGWWFLGAKTDVPKTGLGLKVAQLKPCSSLVGSHQVLWGRVSFGKSVPMLKLFYPCRMMLGSCLHSPPLLRSRASCRRTWPTSSGGCGLTTGSRLVSTAPESTS